MATYIESTKKLLGQNEDKLAQYWIYLSGRKESTIIYDYTYTDKWPVPIEHPFHESIITRLSWKFSFEFIVEIYIALLQYMIN